MLPSFVTLSSLVAQAFILIFISVIYIFFISCIFPSVFLKPEYNRSLEGDRGLKKYRFPGGHSIVYEPSVDIKKYMKQYILTALGDEKYFQCKFDFRVFSARYEIFAFDCENRMLDAIHVAEPVREDAKYISLPTMLPSDTAYIKVSLKAVNETKILRDPTLSIPSSKFAAFRFFVVLFTIAQAFIIKFMLLDMAEFFFPYLSTVKDYGNLFTLFIAIVTGLILSSFGKTLHGLGKREKEDWKNYKKRLKEKNRK